jgi:hypothetical protein
MICDECHAGAAIFHVTVRRAERDYATGHFCDPCYRALSKDQISDFADPHPEELPVRRPGTPDDHFVMFLRAMTVGLSEEDAREITEAMLREVVRRGGKLRT